MVFVSMLSCFMFSLSSHLTPQKMKFSIKDFFSKCYLYKCWWGVFTFIQIYLPRAVRTKTWISRGTCNILGFGPNNIFVYNVFDKRNKIPFFIVRIPYLSNNILTSVLQYSLYSEFLRLARCTLRFTDFVPKAS